MRLYRFSLHCLFVCLFVCLCVCALSANRIQEVTNRFSIFSHWKIMLTPQSSQKRKTLQETVRPKKLKIRNSVLHAMQLSIRLAVALVIIHILFSFAHIYSSSYLLYRLVVCMWLTLNTNCYGTTFGGVSGSFNSVFNICFSVRNTIHEKNAMDKGIDHLLPWKVWHFTLCARQILWDELGHLL